MSPARTITSPVRAAKHGERAGPGEPLVARAGGEHALCRVLGLLVLDIPGPVACALGRDRADQQVVAGLPGDRGGPLQCLAALVDHCRGLAAQREMQQRGGVLRDCRRGQPVDDRLELAHIEGLDRGGRALRQQRGGRVRVAERQHELERRAQIPAPRVFSSGPAQYHVIGGAQRREVVAHRAGQVPPVVLARGEGNPGGQRAGEVAVNLGGLIDRRRIEQRQPADLGERLAFGRRERVERLVQDRRDRAERLVRVARGGQRADVLAGALGAGGGQRRRRGPATGRPFQPGNLRWADVEPEARPAQLQRLLRPQRKVGRGELGAVRPAQPRGALGQAPGEHDKMLVGLQLLGAARAC